LRSLDGLPTLWPKCWQKFLAITFLLNFCHTNCFNSQFEIWLSTFLPLFVTSNTKTKTDKNGYYGTQTTCSSTLRVRCKSVTKYRILVNTPHLSVTNSRIHDNTSPSVNLLPCKSVTQYRMFLNTSRLLSVGNKFPHARQHVTVTIRPPPTGVTQARDTWDVTPPSPLPPGVVDDLFGGNQT
jgi:hypothetical protein